MLGRHEQIGLSPLAVHSEFGPQGDGKQGSLSSFGCSGSGTHRENGDPTIRSGQEQTGT